MTKRIYFCLEDFFIQILTEVDVKHTNIKDEDLRLQLKEIKSGCVVLVCVKNKPNFNTLLGTPEHLTFLQNNYLDSLCCYNSAVRISTMINKEHQHVFNLKYNLPTKNTDNNPSDKKKDQNEIENEEDI